MANPFHDERGRFGSAGSGGSGRAKLAGEAKRRMGEAVAHRERVAAMSDMPHTRASDARGVDQPESRPMRIVSRQTRTDPPKKDRSASGPGRSFYG
jgi:hypothetical protein